MGKDVLQGIMIPFVGTVLGSACVLFMRNKLNPLLQKSLTGFAAGVMVAASIWSLLIPAMDQSASMGQWAFLPAAAGFWLGILFLLLLDRTVPHLHMNSTRAEGARSSLKKSTMLVLAVTLHNLPEGMAVGVVYAGWLSGDAEISAMGALALSLGIALQNFPEGAVISMPLRGEGAGRGKAFLYGALCGGAPGSSTDHSHGGICGSVPALFAEFCGGGHDLCGGGRADPGDVGGRSFQYRNRSVCRRLYGHDGSGCGIRIGFMEPGR